MMSASFRSSAVVCCVLSVSLLAGERASDARIGLPLRPPETYSVQDLGPLGDAPGAGVFALNQVGQAAGAYSIGIPGGDSIPMVHACLWSPSGVQRDLGTLGGLNSYAFGLNDVGQVVGASETAALTGSGVPMLHAFVWSEATGMQDLGVAGIAVSARAINNAGKVAGNAGERAFSWTSAGGSTELPVLFGAFQSSAVAINEAGVVVGTTSREGPILPGTSSLRPHLTRWGADNSVSEPSGPSRFSAGADINAHGEIAGHSYSLDFDRDQHQHLLAFNGSFVQSTRKTTVTLGRNFKVARINAKGEGVGLLVDAQAPALWRRGALINLQHRIPPQEGWTLGAAADLNDAGRILVQGRASDGSEHALLLVPDVKPNCAQDVTDQVTITRVPTSARSVSQTLSIRNTGGAPIEYPDLVLEGLPPGVRWTGGTRRTVCFKPAGSPYARLLAAGDTVLDPGEAVTINLNFAGKVRGAIRFRSRILAGAGVR